MLTVVMAAMMVISSFASILFMPGLTNAEVEAAGYGITNVYGQNRYETSLAIADALKSELGVYKFDSIVVARGDSYPDALSGGYLAYKYNAPLIIVNNNNYMSALSYIRSNLKTGGTIFLLGGSYAVSNSMEQSFRAITPDVMRLSGQTRYDTNLAILKESMSVNDDLLICSGQNFPDALSASGAGRPIMLVGKSLTAEQENFIKERSSTIRRIYIIGGNSAVSQTVENQISQYRIPTRIAGTNRYGTSVAVASMFYPTATEATFASGANFPDGLCGGVLSARLNAPLLLTSQNAGFISAYQYVLNQPSIRHATIFGGSMVVSDDATGLNKNTGSKKTGLLEIGKSTYCTDVNGNLMQRSFFTINGNRYFAAKSGEVVKDTAFSVDGEYYGARSDGTLVESGWEKTGNLHYYFKDYHITEESLSAKDVLDDNGRSLTTAYQWSRGLADYTFESGFTYRWGAAYFARFGFNRNEGNSFVKAATFYFMAKTLGYDARLMYGTVGTGEEEVDHAWVDIIEDGMYYSYDLTLSPGWKISYMDTETYSRYNYPRYVMQVEDLTSMVG